MFSCSMIAFLGAFITYIFIPSYYSYMLVQEGTTWWMDGWIDRQISIQPCIHTFILHLFFYPSIIYVLIHPSIHPSIYLFIHSFILSFIHLSIHSYIHSFIHISIYPSIHAFTTCSYYRWIHRFGSSVFTTHSRSRASHRYVVCITLISIFNIQSTAKSAFHSCWK